MEFRLKALTPVWTGGVKRNDNSILHLTGIKGSIRWWHEVLIRGLDCYACDPTSNGHCELKPKELDRDKPLTPQIKKQICPVCYMFGCTGWSGKFNLRVKDENGSIKRVQIKADDTFVLEFVEKKRFEPLEKLLLQMSFKLIVDYGSIGGKTALKPSEENTKNNYSYKGGIHGDYGLLRWAQGNDVSASSIYAPNREKIKLYLKAFKEVSTGSDEWPDLKNFWFVKDGYIKRSEHNRIVNRRDDNGRYLRPDAFQLFLGGYIPRENVGPADENTSKKIFSFHGINPQNNTHIIHGIRRCFGYVKENELDNVLKLITEQVNRLKGKIKRGEDVLDEL